MSKSLIGIDEVGRGCLAGPVAVGAVIVYSGKSQGKLKEARSSKKISAKKRREWFKWAEIKKEEGMIDYAVSYTSPAYIDKYGLTRAIQKALNKNLRTLCRDAEGVSIKMDGALYAPQYYPFQETIIGGDEIEPAISLASIIAKVKRDELMLRKAKKYPQYGFERHKGYGTKCHKEKIARHGICFIHRTTFIHL